MCFLVGDAEEEKFQVAASLSKVKWIEALQRFSDGRQLALGLSAAPARAEKPDALEAPSHSVVRHRHLGLFRRLRLNRHALINAMKLLKSNHWHPFQSII